MATTALREEVRDELVRTARTVVGDELRSLTHFTEDTVDQLYLRSDLDPEANLTGFAETERLGFRSQWDYGASELGDYHFTIRVFDHGYLTRVIVGDHGVFVTTDPLARTRFEELAAAIKGVLREDA
jgi:hypothetical protein